MKNINHKLCVKLDSFSSASIYRSIMRYRNRSNIERAYMNDYPVLVSTNILDSQLINEIYDNKRNR